MGITGNHWESFSNQWESKQSGESKIQLFPPWEIRGYRSTQIGTGVTYALCFRVDDSHDLDTNSRLNIYLQVGFHSDNYFGWILREVAICDGAKSWYESTQYDRIKAKCTDAVLNKGGTLSLSASCNKMKIAMFTDNLSVSTPKLTTETQHVSRSDAIVNTFDLIQFS